MSVLGNRPTPKCKGPDFSTHLSLDTACLHVTNTDESKQLELWAQSQECYKCPPWKYLNLTPHQTRALVVNTTYPTDLFVKNLTGSTLSGSSYHFGDYGDYSININEQEISAVSIYRQPVAEYLPVIGTAIFLVMLVFLWQLVKFIKRRMDASFSSRQHQQTSASEVAPLLSSSGGVSSSNTVYGTTVSQANASAPPPQQVRTSVPDSKAMKTRLASLDAFRGTAIVLMIFVNYGGGKYYFFKHARWNGLTVADLVFPWFLWIMGVSLTFSIRSQIRRREPYVSIIYKIAKRSLILFALGIIINSDGHNYMPTFRILGVLQRFAFCYLVIAVLEVLCMSPTDAAEYTWYWPIRDLVWSWFQWIFTLLLVVVHVLITFLLPVPGCPKGYLGPGGLHDGGAYANCTGGAAGYVDQVILGVSHMYQRPTCYVIYDNPVPYDPEGFLGILTSCLIVQLGVATGRIILTHHSHLGRLMRWLIWGIVLGIVSGLLCGWSKEDGVIPVNKNLWSVSYVLCTASFAFFLFALYYVLIDERHWWNGNPFRFAGMNSILLYVGHEICQGLFPWSWSPVGEYHSNNMVMNVWGTGLWIAIAYICHRKKFYLSV